MNLTSLVDETSLKIIKYEYKVKMVCMDKQVNLVTEKLFSTKAFEILSPMKQKHVPHEKRAWFRESPL